MRLGAKVGDVKKMIAEEIRKLREIQHLALIRDEDANLGAGKQGESLSVKMEGLVARLDEEALAIYKRLQQKGRIFLSPLAKGNCSACGMKVPTSVLQHVIALKTTGWTGCGSAEDQKLQVAGQSKCNLRQAECD